jgi:NAD(P)-dependent dehydrogenase (short-subunit alcohol dehydrogenase family)
MRILIVGAAGTFGRAIHQRLQERGHDIITVGRTTGDIRCDIADERQLARLWEQAGQVDAVVSAAGAVKYAPLDQLSSGDFLESFTQKGLAQINLVRTGLDHVASRGSFTLTSGIPSRDPVISSAAAATVNGAVEAFVRAAAIEIAPRRINVVSPSVATESLETFGDYFPGFASVDLTDVARGFQKSVEGAATGQVIILP